MKKLLAAAIVLVAVLTCIGFYEGGQSEEEKETKVYSFSGSDENFTVSNGTVVLSDEEEIFYGGELTVNSQAFFDGVTSCRTCFYILSDGEKETVMVNEIIDLSGGKVIFEGDLGKISSAPSDALNNAECTETLKSNLYFEITVSGTDGKETTRQLKMNVTEVK